MWINKQDVNDEMRKGGSPDECVNCLKVRQIFVIQ